LSDDAPGEDEWRQSQGRFTGTYEVQNIAKVARAQLPQDSDVGLRIIVTDQEITPPEGFTYIIWDRIVSDQGIEAVVSTVPMYPSYWGAIDPDPLSVVRSRLVSVCCLLIGEEALGLRRCDTPTCFLYEKVPTVSTLDAMTRFCDKHGNAELASIHRSLDLPSGSTALS
jgi:hypothetical protein